MKYLKNFNESKKIPSEYQEILDTCKDILVELKDEGFSVDVIYNKSASINENPSYTIIVYRHSKFTKADVLNTFNHIESYFNSIGYTTNNEFPILRRYPPNWYDLADEELEESAKYLLKKTFKF